MDSLVNTDINSNSTEYSERNIAVRYFRYHFKETFIRLVVLSAIAMIIMYNSVSHYRHEVNFAFTTGEFMLCVFAFLMPRFEFVQFKSRNHLDLWYQIPLARRTLGYIHAINGAIQIVVSFTLGYFCAIARLCYYTSRVDVLATTGYFCITLVSALLMYGTFLFVYDRANTNKDGIIFQIAYLLVFEVIFLAFVAIISTNESGYETAVAMMSGSVGVSTPVTYFSECLNTEIIDALGKTSYSRYLLDSYHVGMIVIMMIVDLAATVGFFFAFGKKPAYKAEEVSDSWFGYKTLIPIFAASLIILEGRYAAYAITPLLIGCYVAYVIYRRSPKIKRNDIFVMAGLLLFAIIWGLFCSALV